MFEDLEEVAEKNMEVQDQLSKVKEEHQSKLLEREEAEAECQEVSAIRVCVPHCIGTKIYRSDENSL